MRGERHGGFDLLPGLVVLVLFLSNNFDKTNAVVMVSSELEREQGLERSTTTFATA